MTQVSSLYLHVPFCLHLCNYCDFYKRKLDPDLRQFEDFHQFLRSSLVRHEVLLEQEGFSLGALDTVYLGGGTPSLWGKEGAGVFSSLGFKLKTDAEFTMEVDPGTWTEDLLSSWKDLGLNRISVGTQTLDENFLKIMDRLHSLEDSLRFLKKLQTENWNFSLDFLLGIPYSKEKNRNIKDELDRFLSYSPKHVSLYILNARSRYPHINELPDDEYIREEFLFVSDYLRSQGFHHYEVSNFALPGFESRHNQKYWQGESVAALGPTGTGYLNLGKDKALRYKWKVSEAEVEIERLGRKELELEEMYLGLRTSLGWSPMEPTQELKQLFRSWQTTGLGTWDGKKMILNSQGFVILDSLMDEIFRI